MAGGGPDGTGSLRPVRWLHRPGGGTLLRLGLVAALLGLAVVVLDSSGGCPTPVPSSPGASAGGATAGGTPATAAAGVGPAGGPSAGSRSDDGPPGAGPSAGGGRPGALPLPNGAVGVPVRLAEPAALAVLRPGARVDLLVVPAGRAPAEAGLLAPGALVLDVLGGDATDGSSALYLALRPDQAQRAVGQPEGSRFAVVVRG
ncbi:flagellar biosynthesis protein FlgA [Micromonospora sp. NPDC050200]|uniref:flagellar biosynthesis protein FlgA n=1 Tax=Micromonospora sp. NPDC050200 TaxID=3155664 RepID=UPI0033E037C8